MDSHKGEQSSTQDKNNSVTNGETKKETYAQKRAKAYMAKKAYWISDSRSNCEVWHPNRTTDPNARIEWNGQCSDGKATGKGILKWYLNDELLAQYEGEYLNGKMNGAGILTFESHGRRYEGQFQDNLEHGFRTIFSNISLPTGSRTPN